MLDPLPLPEPGAEPDEDPDEPEPGVELEPVDPLPERPEEDGLAGVPEEEPLIPEDPVEELDPPEALTPNALEVWLSSCPVACIFLDF